MLEAVHLGPASKGTPKQLVVLCHGLGADAYDLLDLAPSWADAVPDALFASVNAPDEHFSGFGRQWWAVGDRRPEIMLAGVRRAAGFLNEFIDAESGASRAAPRCLCSDGVQPGGHDGSLVHRPSPSGRAASFILGFSGALIAPDTLAAELRNKAPVLLVHGEEDGQVPVQRSRDAETALLAAGVPVEALVVSPRLGRWDPR